MRLHPRCENPFLQVNDYMNIYSRPRSRSIDSRSRSRDREIEREREGLNIKNIFHSVPNFKLNARSTYKNVLLNFTKQHSYSMLSSNLVFMSMGKSVY